MLSLPRAFSIYSFRGQFYETIFLRKKQLKVRDGHRTQKSEFESSKVRVHSKNQSSLVLEFEFTGESQSSLVQKFEFAKIIKVHEFSSSSSLKKSEFVSSRVRVQPKSQRSLVQKFAFGKKSKVRQFSSSLFPSSEFVSSKDH